MQARLNTITPFLIGGSILTLVSSVQAQEQSLKVVYPPQEHKTTAEQIFFIGTAPSRGEVLINGEPINRSSGGHFAPSLPLEIGENQFQIRHEEETISFTITRVANTPAISTGVDFAADSLSPTSRISRLSGESICFSAVAPTNAEVSVLLQNEVIPLTVQDVAILPPNSALLTFANESVATASKYQGCTSLTEPGNYGTPRFRLRAEGQEVTQSSSGEIAILADKEIKTIAVTAREGVARTGPGTNYSRLTPLPQGTRARVTGREGDYLRLDYGGWIRAEETETLAGSFPESSVIRSLSSREVPGATEVVFPLQTAVPISIRQDDQDFTLTLHNLVAQTDTIFIGTSPVIKRLDWRQVSPTTVEYKFKIRSPQQWGYDLRYEGNNLILALHHPPEVLSGQSLAGVEILLDPGHGGEELGARGPTGLPEKTPNLQVSLLLQKELLARGATVYMTRETDQDVSLRDRVDQIAEISPDLAISIHYNALPDGGDAENTAGIGAFWYHPQAHSLAEFLHDYLVQKLDRPSYGVFWNNLALTRPHAAPSVLLELGFMINPEEFEWIVNPDSQIELSSAIADSIVEWVARQTTKEDER